jgi:hypothetical protein
MDEHYGWIPFIGKWCLMFASVTINGIYKLSRQDIEGDNDDMHSEDNLLCLKMRFQIIHAPKILMIKTLKPLIIQA